MLKIDRLWTHAVNSQAGYYALLDSTMIYVSKLVVPLVVLAVALQWWRKGASRDNLRHTIGSAGLACALGLLTNQIILLFMQRPRPYVSGLTHLLTAPSTDPSFPSDHATATIAIAAAFLLNGARLQGSLFLLIAVIVGYSRIFIGTHYVTDVIGGALTGVLAASAIRIAYPSDTKIDRFLVSIF